MYQLIKNSILKEKPLWNIRIGSPIKFLLLGLILSSCDNCIPSNASSSDVSNETSYYEVQSFKYDSLTIPIFFKNLTRNHLKDFVHMDSLEFKEFCTSNNIDRSDSSNIIGFYTIKILHELFTSKTAANCSTGDILNIPYQWHWIDPNPRHEIFFVNSNIRLTDTSPPPEFSKYNSFADIDRTPYFFLSDFVSPSLNYYSSTCDTFSTFGWCSEREMAFVALTQLLEFEGKIVAEGIHSWTEILFPMKLKVGKVQDFIIKVDNTFDSIKWSPIRKDEITKWKAYHGNTNLADWYNRKATSTTELRRIENHIVSNEAIQRIEEKLVEYLNRRINQTGSSK